MSLKEQIISILFSIIYGIVIYFIYRKTYNLIHYYKKIYAIFNSFLFTIDVILIYFIIFLNINDGIINYIFIIITFLTFLVLNKIYLQKKCKTMSNRL